MLPNANPAKASNKRFIEQLIDLIIYSNFNIALGAGCMGLQTYLLFFSPLELTPLVFLIFCSTLVIYALHRLIGLPKVQDFLTVERYKVIFERKYHIWVYAIMAIIGGAYCFFKVSFSVQIALVAPAAISLLYVLPILGGKRNLRLRDFNMIKIYLIAIVWAYVTVLLPAIELETIWSPKTWLMFIERALFVFAITLPFDIRDLKVDKHTEVNTIPARIGIQNTIRLAWACLGVFSVLAIINYGLLISIPLLVSAISTGVFVYFSAPGRHDYFYSGLLDGTMTLQFLFVLGIYYLGWMNA
ncbi:MAG: hypothetical protein AAF502_13600 [Bacteroidota bacterium]